MRILTCYKKKLFYQFVTILVITVFLPIIVIGGISYFRAKEQIKVLVTELLEQVVKNINSQIDGIVDETDYITLQIATQEPVKKFIELKRDDYYEKYVFHTWFGKSILLEEMFFRIPIATGLSIIGDNGNVYSSGNNKRLDKIHYEIGKEEYLKRAEYLKENLAQNGSTQMVLTKITTGIGPNFREEDYYVTMGRRIFQRAKLSSSGSLIVDIKADTLNKIWEGEDLKDGYISIIDEEGQFIYHPDHDKIGTIDTKLGESKELDFDKGSFLTKLDGEKQFIVYSSSERTGWKVIATIPDKNLSVPVQNFRNIIVFTGLICFPFTVMIGYLFIRSTIKPLFHLKEHMRQVEREEWNSIGGNIPENEIGDLVHAYNRMIRKISDLIESVYKAEVEHQQDQVAKHKAEFQALQAQINPHFLYNTLGTIHAYAIISDDIPIQEMVKALGSMLRYSIQNPMETVKLCEEIEHVRNYLLIQKHRQKRMPKVGWEVDPYIEHPVIRLTLQPLVENVFQHGFREGIEPNHILRIGVKQKNGCLILFVEDNGLGIGDNGHKNPEDRKAKRETTGIGLRNIHRRMQLAYGIHYGVDIKGNEDGGATVEVYIPFSKSTIDFTSL